MAGKKKKEDGSQCLSDENILKKKKNKKPCERAGYFDFDFYIC